MIKLVDKNGVEVAEMTSFGCDSDKLIEVTTFSDPVEIFMPERGNMIMHVRSFKTPVQIPGPAPRATAPQQISLGSAAANAQFITDVTNKLARLEKVEGNLAGANKIIVALVRMMGGAVSLSAVELDAALPDALEADTMANDGIMIRVKDPV